MVPGRVTDSRDPVVDLELAVHAGLLTSPAVIDTGFNGYLSVPIALVRQSSWLYVGHEEYELAGGQVVFEPVYLATVRFDDRLLQVSAVASEGHDILIGTRFLDGKRLVIDFGADTVSVTDVRPAT